MSDERLYRAARALEKAGLAHLLVSDPVSIRYLTGIKIEPMERLYALYLRTDGKHVLFLNKLFCVTNTGINEVWINDTDDAVRIVANHIENGVTLGIDKNWPARFLLKLMEYNGGAKYVVASDCIDTIRSKKDAEEIGKMRAASVLNDTCVDSLAAWMHEGHTEFDCVEKLKELYTAHGASGCSFTPIIAFGSNAGDPHHESDGTVLSDGCCVLVDTGCVLDGYCSDMTRTFFYKSVSPLFENVYAIVREANERAERAVKPGMRFCDIDKIARDYITQAGYGEQFTHRLGHSIGLECHESGDVSATNTAVLEEGMIFSIEPGVYLRGSVGVRIEDLVLVTESGAEILNRSSKNLRIIGM